MNVLQLTDYNKLEYLQLPDPVIKTDDDVIIRVKACGICGSDVHGLDGSTGRRKPPAIMGHEATGIVEAVGKAVKRLKPGDRVAFEPTQYCGDCRYCRSGRTNLCEQRRVLGISCDEYKVDGAYAELVVVSQKNVHIMPDSVSFRQGALIEPLSIAMHAVKVSGFMPTDTALVFGSGTIGLMAVQILSAYGCENIIVADRNDDKLELAKSLGAHHTVNTKSNEVRAAVMAATGNKGVDCAYDCIGLASVANICLDCMSTGACLTLIGLMEKTAELPFQRITANEWRIQGAFVACRGDYPECIELIAQKKVIMDPFISAVAPLSEGAEWFTRLKNKERGLMKVLLEP